MQTTDYTTRVIQADAGHFLTQAEDVEIANRIITNQPIYLAYNDDPANWREITQAEADEYEAQRIAAEEAEKAEREQELPEAAAEPDSEPVNTPD